MQILLSDIRSAFRSLFRNFTFTGVVILALALSIGAATAIFSVVNAVLLRPLPFPDSDRLALIWETETQLPKAPVTPADFLDWKAHVENFEAIAAYKSQTFNLIGQDEPERLRGVAVSAEFFAVLGVAPLAGRSFTADDDQAGAPPVVILSRGFWQRRFGGESGIVGHQILLNGRKTNVIGIMSEAGQFPRTAEIWAPLAMTPAEMKVRDTHYLNVVGRFKPGINIRQAQAEMDRIANQLQQDYPASNMAIGASVVSLLDQVVANVRPALVFLFGAVGFVVLIACANIANLLLARATVREREMAIRAAVGAPRSRIFRQLLTESLVWAFLGGLLGFLLAYWGTPLIVAVSPGSIPRSAEIGMDYPVLGFCLLLTVVTGLIFGLAPAVRMSRPDLNDILKDVARAQKGGIGRLSLRGLLVVSEIGLALILLIGASLMMRSFVRLQNVAPGFDATNVLTMQITLPASKYAGAPRQVAFFREALERVQNVPGVETCGTINFLPLSGSGSSTGLSFEDEGMRPVSESPLAEYRVVSPGYFRAMKIALKAGRYVSDEDSESAHPTVVISETLAKQFFGNVDPIGKRIGLSGPVDWREIVGVVGDVKDYALNTPAKPMCYIPMPQASAGYNQYNTVALVARTGSDPVRLSSSIRGAIQAVDKDQPVYNISTLQQVMENVVAQPRLYMLLLNIFAGIAVVLSLVGIYSVMAYSVRQRTYEIGMRVALGAAKSDIFRMILRQAMVLTIVGITLGLAGAFIVTRLMETMLFDVSPTDLATFGGVSLLLAVVAVFASMIPAHRATKVSPLVAMRFG